MTRRGGRAEAAPRALVIAAVVALVACTDGGSNVPSRLVDGTATRDAPVELENVSDAVLTRVETLRLEEVVAGSSAAHCLRRWKRDVRAAAPIVRRLGVHTETVTFRDESGMWLLACDDSTGPREAGRRWCGSIPGRLYAGRLRDPRVDIGCTTADGARVGFAWVQPVPRARYVAVEQDGYTEVYEAAGGLPIRTATTSGVVVEGARARFQLSDHASDGSLLRQYGLDAPVAG